MYQPRKKRTRPINANGNCFSTLTRKVELQPVLVFLESDCSHSHWTRKGLEFNTSLVKHKGRGWVHFHPEWNVLSSINFRPVSEVIKPQIERGEDSKRGPSSRFTTIATICTPAQEITQTANPWSLLLRTTAKIAPRKLLNTQLQGVYEGSEIGKTQAKWQIRVLR